MEKRYNSFRYYGTLVKASTLLEYCLDNGEYPLSNNGIQGNKGLEFIEELLKFDDIVVQIDDTLDDNNDTVFITFNDSCSSDDIKRIVALVCSVKPDEFNFSNDLKVLRIWWD